MTPERFCFWNSGAPIAIRNTRRAKSPTGVVLQSVNRAMPEFDLYEYVEVGSASPSGPGKIVSANHVLNGDIVTTTYSEADDPAFTDADRAAVLAAAKASTVREIDDSAEAARLQFITAGAGQALVYARKEAQARACLTAYDAQNPPPAGAFPALDAEVGITGASVVEVATVVVGMADLWASIADIIEATRLAAKAAVAAAADAAAVEAVEAGLSWPQPA